MASLWIIGTWFCSIIAIVGMGLAHIFESSLPKFCQDIILYGKLKTKNTGGSFLQYFDVPKSWFKYFYIFSVFFNLYVSISFTTSVWQGKELPPFLNWLLDFLETSRSINTDTKTAALLLWMFVFHSVRRSYECLFVSVFSKSTLSVFLFVEAFLLYGSCSLAVIIETARPGLDTAVQTSFSWRHAVGTVVFLWASYHQFDTHRRFASFRTNKSGDIVNYDHVVPHGGYFEYVSCPNYLMEIIEYVAYFIIAGAANLTLLSVLLFVLFNQITLSLMAHKWYREHFKAKYPANRKAVIPFIL